MISEKHSAAARINGAKSRGPRTPEGKAISARNARRHGMLAKCVLLPNEEPSVFEELFNANVERFGPVDDVEMSLIEEMTAACWRLRRAMALETASLSQGIADSRGASSLEQTLDAYSDPARAAHLDRIERMQARLQSAYHRALRGLAQIRKINNRPAPVETELEVEEICENEPSSPNVCNTVGSTEALPNPARGPIPTFPMLPRRRQHARALVEPSAPAKTPPGTPSALTS